MPKFNRIVCLNSDIPLILLFWGSFFIALWPTWFVMNEQGLATTSRTIWGDWAAHLAYANVFAYRPVDEWFATHPLFLLKPFNYPAVADMISGLLMRSGVSVVSAFVIPSIITTLALLTLMGILYRRTLGGRWGPFFAVSLFLCSGGLGFAWLALDLISQQSIQPLLQNQLEWTYLQDQHIEYLNIVFSELLPQRSLLLGLVYTLLILNPLYRAWKDEFKNYPIWKTACLGLAASGLVLVHAHSLIALAIICACMTLTQWHSYRHWMTLFWGTAVPGLLIMKAVGLGAGMSGFFEWYPGWMTNPKEAHQINWLYFWWLNWGVFLPLAIVGTWIGKWYRNPLVIAGFAIFIIANLVRFQPWAWDNTKLLTWSYMLLAIPATDLLRRMANAQNKLMPVSAAGLLFTATASGALDIAKLIPGAGHDYQMWDKSTIELAAQFRSISSPTDRVICADYHRSWVESLAGRQVLMGFGGWLWSYGIDYSDTQNALRRIFAGGDQTAGLLTAYQVNFVVIGPEETARYSANETYFAERYPLVLESAGQRVYRVSK